MNLDDFKKPVNYISLLLAVVSIIWGFWSHYSSINERKPIYALKGSPLKIFDKRNSLSSINLVSNDTCIISEDVYLITFILWNEGNLPIDNQDIREQFKISLQDSINILDFKVIEETHKGISQFSLCREKQKNNLLIKWNFFDPGFAMKAQIIYCGAVNPQFKIKGYILGENQVSEIAQHQDRKPIKIISLIFISAISLIIFLMLISEKVRIEFTKSFLYYDKPESEMDLQKGPYKTILILLIYIIGIFIYYYQYPLVPKLPL